MFCGGYKDTKTKDECVLTSLRLTTIKSRAPIPVIGDFRQEPSRSPDRCTAKRLHAAIEGADQIPICLKLVRTNLNYRVLGTSTAAIFLSNVHSLYAPITSDEFHALFHLYGTSRPATSALKATQYKIKNLVHSWTRTQNLEMSSLMLYRLSYQLWWKWPFYIYIHVLTILMYTMV